KNAKHRYKSSLCFLFFQALRLSPARWKPPKPSAEYFLHDLRMASTLFGSRVIPAPAGRFRRFAKTCLVSTAEMGQMIEAGGDGDLGDAASAFGQNALRVVKTNL